MSNDVSVVKYKVTKEDNLWNIVKKAGFPPKDWKKILNAPYNKDFVKKLKKEKRTADRIFPGDILFLPEFNSKDIMKKYESVKKMRVSLGEGLQQLSLYEKGIGKVKDERNEENSGKWTRIEKLEKEAKRKSDAIEQSNKPSPGEHFSERTGKAFGKAYLRYTEGVMEMRKEANRLRREIKSTSSKFRVATMRLEGIVKQVKKDIKVAADEIKKGEAELSKMLKNPY